MMNGEKRTCSIYVADAEFLARVAGWNRVTVADVVAQLVRCFQAEGGQFVPLMAQEGGVTTPPTENQCQVPEKKKTGK